MMRTVAVLLALVPAPALAASSDQLVQGAAAIRAAGYPCPKITQVTQSGRTLKVECGRLVYRVTVRPLTLKPW